MIRDKSLNVRDLSSLEANELFLKKGAIFEKLNRN